MLPPLPLLIAAISSSRAVTNSLTVLEVIYLCFYCIFRFAHSAVKKHSDDDAAISIFHFYAQQ